MRLNRNDLDCENSSSVLIKLPLFEARIPSSLGNSDAN